MGYPPIEDLLPKAGNSVYKLVRLAAHRALELADGKKKLVESALSEKTTTIALEEIKAGKVVAKEVVDEYIPKESRIMEQPRSNEKENEEEGKE